MRSRAPVLVACLVAFLIGPAPARAESFYSGKTVRVIVGFVAGGGFDAYARLLARHVGKRLPGQPTVIVENMPGAGSLISANHLYTVARPDGLTIGTFNGPLMLGQVLGRPGIEFDARRYEFIGAAVKEDVVCALTRASGITSIERWRAAKMPAKLGGTGPGATPDNSGRVLKAALGLPIQVVTGYRGTAEIRLAAESGELHGACWAWDSMRAIWHQALASGDVVPIVQLTSRSLPDLPDVPRALDLASTDEGRRLIQIGIHASSAVARPFVAPPRTPRERVQLLRDAFQAAWKDPALLAEAERARLSIDPVTGEELERLVGDLFTLDPTMVTTLKEILYR